MSYFGFIPSESLLNNVETGVEKKNSNEPLYPLRDQTALKMTDEIIDATLTELVRRFPASEKRDTLEKLAGYIKSTVSVLLKQLLGKAPNDVVRQSIEFSEKSTFTDSTGTKRIGLELDPKLVEGLKANFADILAGKEVNRTELTNLHKQFGEAAVRHFMNDFNKTLDLGLIKRKASDLAASAVAKAVNVALDKMIPNYTDEELRAAATYYDTLFFK